MESVKFLKNFDCQFENASASLGIRCLGEYAGQIGLIPNPQTNIFTSLLPTPLKSS